MSQVESRPKPQRPSLHTYNISETITRRQPLGDNHSERTIREHYPEFFALHLNPHLIATLLLGVESWQLCSLVAVAIL